MSAAQHFILVEGVNLYANIYDTDQLSVIRGSSFLYKQALDDITQKFVCQDQCLERLSTGASSGLYRLISGDPAERVRQIEQFLADPANGHYHLLTFVVVQTQAPTLLAAKERLLAQLRFRQLQDLSLQPDRAGSGKDALNTMPCGLSGARIASKWEKQIQSDKPQFHSRSVHWRWEHGREEKQHYYADLVDDPDLKSQLNTLRFVENIEDLCKDATQRLNHKMAVVYVDGNSFSSRQRDFIGGDSTLDGQIKRQQTFDTNIQQQRNNFLTQVLRNLLPKQWGDTLRLETLLWGGDEMLFVMPAWAGFDFLQSFFEFKWHLNDGKKGAEEALTHAAGIVFCQANTPIRIIQQLARELAEGVKEHDRTHNGWDYLVLESIDYPTNEKLGGYFQERYGDALAKLRPRCLPCMTAWSGTERERLEAFLKERAISRGQLYQIVHAIKQSPLAEPSVETWEDVLKLSGDSLKQASQQEQAERRMFEVSDDQATLTALGAQAKAWLGLDMDCPRQRAWFWIHLLELWDYLSPQLTPEAARQAEVQP